jgi:hypothetical protein
MPAKETVTTTFAPHCDYIEFGQFYFVAVETNQTLQQQKSLLLKGGFCGLYTITLAVVLSTHLAISNCQRTHLAYGLGRLLGLLDFLDLLRPGRLWWLLGCTDRGLVLCRKRTILFHQQLDDLAD